MDVYKNEKSLISQYQSELRVEEAIEKPFREKVKLHKSHSASDLKEIENKVTGIKRNNSENGLKNKSEKVIEENKERQSSINDLLDKVKNVFKISNKGMFII